MFASCTNTGKRHGIHPTNKFVGVWFSFGRCWGLVLNEAMALGKPVVSTDAVGGAHDLIKNGVNGFRVKHGSVEELHSTLKKDNYR